MTWLLLLRRFWYVVPMAVLGGLATFWHIRADYAVKARDNAVEELRLAKVAAFDEGVRQRRIGKEELETYRAKARTADARANALAERLRDYFARPVPVPAAPGGTDDPPAEPPSYARVGEMLGGLVRACAADAARLEGLQAYIGRVTDTK